MASSVETRIRELGLTLPDAPAPAANYVPYVISGNLVFISGQIAQGPDGPIRGRLGEDLDLEAGVKAAEACALALVAQAKAAAGGISTGSRGWSGSPPS